ncbi:MAG: saccharopine dehydrogenase NADP-binding domain-containing protein [Chitinophaga sp.]|uniref:saccharopine dehydrogenase family protein n=1 Tax=Chitinophaga sp. TaxID=1869181 RepID=UPI001B0B5B49|nr:saccharopine dehydrogenase NADP-binding domain-containing protein [Chitinophaga sp.]MBO9733163.1 saccharopine dehydrogenase NADP-binding domain-containing protein [Chitinophaga sp.]
MQQNAFLLYGANGYTGELIARYAAQYQLQPVLAGRNEAALQALAARLQLPYKVISLEDTDALVQALKAVQFVIHAAGPFHLTAEPMIAACIQAKTHYLDINGDITVFEMLQRYDQAAKEAGIMLLPGAGFDVVPTDCIAVLLKTLLPDASDLKLAFATSGGGVSHGTAMSMAYKLGEGGAVRRAGRIIRRPLGHQGRWIDFGRQKLFTMSIPWGDVSTAYVSTRIPNITTYTAVPVNVHRLLKLQKLFNWLLRTTLVRNFIRKKIGQRPSGPTDEMRSTAYSLVWGQVYNMAGRKATVRLKCPDGYTLTMLSCLLMAQKICNGQWKPGYQTPGTAYGAEFIMEIPGVEREIITGES